MMKALIAGVALLGVFSLVIATSMPGATELPRVAGSAPCSLPCPRAEGSVQRVACRTQATQLLRGLPLSFEENRGQFPSDAVWVGKARGAKVFAEHDAITLQFIEREPATSRPQREPLSRDLPEPQRITRYLNVRFCFEGANQVATPEATKPLPGIMNYFLGNDPSEWRTEIPTSSEVTIRELYLGVDLCLRGSPDHALEYDLELAPHATIDQIEVHCQGAESLTTTEQGTVLLVHTAFGTLYQTIPAVWEVLPDGNRHALACRFRLHGPNRFGFDVPDRDLALAMVIDPGLVWSTLLGGTGATSGQTVKGVAVDEVGATTVMGETSSPNFPTTPGAFDTTFNPACPGACYDIFVTRLDPSGSSLVFSTALGGAGDEWGGDMAVDASGAATVVGYTQSPSYPTTPGAFSTSFSGGWQDAFVTRLSSSGSALLYSTYLGGASDTDGALGVAVDAAGAATVVGSTWSTDFPTTTGAFQPGPSASKSAFIARVNPAGSALVYSTYLGGSVPAGSASYAADHAIAVALDAQGDAIVVGETTSADFPTTSGAFDSVIGGNSDGFVARIDGTGSGLVFSTYLGGSAGEGIADVILDATGSPIIVGYTFSPDFPVTPGAYDTSLGPASGKAFVARLASTGSSLLAGTFLGGSLGATAYAVLLDSSGSPVVIGSTNSSDFPVTAGAYDTVWAGAPPGTWWLGDAFIARLDPNLAILRYSTFLGGSGGEAGRGGAFGPDGDLTAVGVTGSSDFPTTPGSFQTVLSGATSAAWWSDCFITRLDLLPTGVVRYGSATAGCAGPPVIGGTSMPQPGNTGFAITCGHAPPNAAGVLGISSGQLSTPVTALGAQIWIDVAAPVFFWLVATSNGTGASEMPLPLPPNPALTGLQAFAQFAWPDACAPGYMSTSAGLAVTIQ